MLSLCVRDLMTADVKTAKPNDPLSTVQDLMNEHNFRHVPVVDDEGMLVGLISERDLLRRALTDEDGMPLTMRRELLGVGSVRHEEGEDQRELGEAAHGL